jgi:hypothetical protein
MEEGVLEVGGDARLGLGIIAEDSFSDTIHAPSSRFTLVSTLFSCTSSFTNGVRHFICLIAYEKKIMGVLAHSLYKIVLHIFRFVFEKKTGVVETVKTGRYQILNDDFDARFIHLTAVMVGACDYLFQYNILISYS